MQIGRFYSCCLCNLSSFVYTLLACLSSLTENQYFDFWCGAGIVFYASNYAGRKIKLWCACAVANKTSFQSKTKLKLGGHTEYPMRYLYCTMSESGRQKKTEATSRVCYLSFCTLMLACQSQSFMFGLKHCTICLKNQNNAMKTYLTLCTL